MERERERGRGRENGLEMGRDNGWLINRSVGGLAQHAQPGRSFTVCEWPRRDLAQLMTIKRHSTRQYRAASRKQIYTAKRAVVREPRCKGVPRSQMDNRRTLSPSLAEQLRRRVENVQTALSFSVCAVWSSIFHRWILLRVVVSS